MENSKSDSPFDSLSSQLANIDELFQSVEVKLEQERPEAYSRSSSTIGGSDNEAAAYLGAAAVLCTFNPEELKPLGAPPNNVSQENNPLNILIGHSAMLIDVKGQVRNSLRDDVRREALAELLETGQVNEALEANHDLAYTQGDTAQRVFRNVLTGSLPPLKDLRLEELTALQLVASWVKDLSLPVPFPSSTDILYQLDRERLLDPFRQLIGRWDGNIFIEHFRGREKELRDLRKYVDVAESETVVESATRMAAGVAAYLLNLHTRPPLVIHGPGGVGKSTLMAKFLLQHEAAHQQERFPFVYIDFDRPDIRPVNAYTLLAEIASQMAMQYPEIKEALMVFRVRMLDPTNQQESLDPSVRVSEFYNIYAQLGSNQPLVLVLDTFEEIQQSSRDDVHNIFLFLDRLQGAFPLLRTVIAGRAPVTEADAGFNAQNYPLLDLDVAAARGYLLSRGITDGKVAAEIIKLTGRQPLALKLAADLTLETETGVEEIREAAGGTGVIARFKRAWSQTDIAGRLYQRILNHITDPLARKLAHPGLVLRRITPEIIRQVLAEPCGLGSIDEIEANKLFERLQRQVSLVAPAETGVIRHRSDVRQMMLPLILQAEAKTATDIQQLAIKFYETKEGTVARAEEIYHRLMLAESPRSVEPRWIDGLKPHLKGSLDELPPRAQAFVAARIGEERPGSVWLAGDVEDWELHAEDRIRKLLEDDKPDRADNLLRQRSDRSTVSRLIGLEALVLNSLGRKEEAQATAYGALLLYNKANGHGDLVEELKKLISTSSQAKTETVLTAEEIKQIVDIFFAIEVDYSLQTRRALFHDVSLEYVMRLPVFNTPFQQLTSDVHQLAQTGPLRDGSYPLVTWLRNAAVLSGNHPQVKGLEAALSKATRRLGMDPLTM